MVVTLPLRMRSAMKAGILRSRTVRRTIRRHGKRRHVRRRVTDMLPALRVPFGRPVNIDGQLAGPDGQGVVGAEVQIVSSSIVSAEEVVAVLQTDGTGRYHYATTASSDRTFRFVYGGSPLVLPVQTTVDLRVPAVSSLSVDHRRVVNGRAVTFSGRTPTSPLPAGGKLIELQVRLSGRWQTFRTTLTDPAGRWAIQYRFKRTRGVQRFRFRARLPREASYPFGAGKSPVITVRVRGRR
jgi:hypothetical protein